MAKRKRKAAGEASRYLEIPAVSAETAGGGGQPVSGDASPGQQVSDNLAFYPDEETGLPEGLGLLDGLSHVGRSVEEAQGVVDGQWLLGHWSGLERWECLVCQWDTLGGLEEAREHRRTCPRCGPAAVASGSVVLVADRRGREIQSDVKGDE